jgi:transposase
MSAAVKLRSDFTVVELRGLAAKSGNANQARRLLALAAVLDGKSREEAALIGGMDRQTLRDWVHRFNRLGPEGLIDKKLPGRKPKLSSHQAEELRRLVESGPDPDTHGVVRWRCVDLKRVLSDRFAVDVSEVSLGRTLKKLGFSHISARPKHPAQKAEAVATYKKTSPTWLRRR